MALVMEDTDLDLSDLRRVKVETMLRKFALTVTGFTLDLKIESNKHMLPYGSPPAWSDANSINLWFDPDGEHPITELDNLIRLKGLTIHELGHVLFTPRDRTELAKKVQDNNLWNVFNILEDNRIDNMMVARLSGVAPWLLHTVLQEFYFAPDSDPTYLLPLVHGRKYIPQKIRDLSAQVYLHPNNVTDIQRVIDEYITLNMARKEHVSRAYELIVELSNLLSSTQPKTQHKDEIAAPAKNGGADMSSIRQQDDALNRAKKQQQAQQADDDTDDNLDSAGNGGGQSTKSDKQQLDEAVNKAQQRAEQDMYDDIKNMVDGMRSGGGVSGSSNSDRRVKPSEYVQLKDVAPEAQLHSRQFARALTELKTLFDPSWQTRQSEGRLNVRDFLMGVDIDESFDLWDDGKSEVSDIECVVLLDISGSMYDMLDSAYDAMWSIKRALDSINASTTVLTFGDYSRVLYSPSSRAGIRRKHSMDGAGGTYPVDGLRYAQGLLESSSRAIKLLITITDGAWGDADTADALIASMRYNGVLTSIVHILDAWMQQRVDNNEFYGDVKLQTHNCEVAHTVRDPHDIAEFAKKLVQMQQHKLIAQ